MYLITVLFIFVFSAVSDVTDEQPVVLDFTKGEPVFIGKSASRQLLITNNTAISASFLLEAEIFHGHRPIESVNKSKYGYGINSLDCTVQYIIFP